MSLKDISFFTSRSHFVWWSRTVCASLIDGIMRNISVQILEFGPVVKKNMPIKDISIFSAGTIFFSRAEWFVQFWQRALWGTFL